MPEAFQGYSEAVVALLKKSIDEYTDGVCKREMDEKQKKRKRTHSQM